MIHHANKYIIGTRKGRVFAGDLDSAYTPYTAYTGLVRNRLSLPGQCRVCRVCRVFWPREFCVFRCLPVVSILPTHPTLPTLTCPEPDLSSLSVSFKTAFFLADVPLQVVVGNHLYNDVVSFPLSVCLSLSCMHRLPISCSSRTLRVEVDKGEPSALPRGRMRRQCASSHSYSLWLFQSCVLNGLLCHLCPPVLSVAAEHVFCVFV